MFKTIQKLLLVKKFSPEELRWALWVYRQVDLKFNLEQEIRPKFKEPRDRRKMTMFID
jgi:hypothetical protein